MSSHAPEVAEVVSPTSIARFTPVSRWAIGASILIAPDIYLPQTHPELIEAGTTDNEAAKAIVACSGMLMINGLSMVLESVAQRLNLGMGSNLRARGLKPMITAELQKDFTEFYDAAKEGVVATPVASSLSFVRVNPFEKSPFLVQFLHSKKHLTLRSLIEPMTPPVWIAREVSLDETLEAHGIK